MDNIIKKPTIIQKQSKIKYINDGDFKPKRPRIDDDSNKKL